MKKPKEILNITPFGFFFSNEQCILQICSSKYVAENLGPEENYE